MCIRDSYTKTCEKWLKKADIKVNKSVWKKVDFNDLSVTMKVEDQEPYANDVKTDDQVDTDSEGQ